MTMGRPSTSVLNARSSRTLSAAPTSIHWPAMLEHPGLEPGRLGHHGLIPWRIEHQFDLGLADGGDHLDLVGRIIHQDVAHAAAWSRERHFDVDTARAVFLRIHRAV